MTPAGTAPTRTGPAWTDKGEYRVVVEPSPRRIRVFFNGATIADSRAMRLLHETRHAPVYYFPFADVDMRYLKRTAHSTHCPHKGDASYWTITVGDKVSENAVWAYEDPIAAQPALKGLCAFYWNRVDRWMEEDEDILFHPKNPYCRVDVVKSSRHVRITVDGAVIAESIRPMVLFETGLPPRYYLPREDVRMDRLVRTDLRTGCPYKGHASYWSIKAGGQMLDNVVWSYEDPLPESERLRGLLAFWSEKIDAVEVDGQRI